MADIKLTKAELAALDAVIASLQEHNASIIFPRTTILTPVIRQLLWVMPRITTKTMLTDLEGPYRRAATDARAAKVTLGGAEVPEKLSLKDLVALRKRLG